MHLLGILFSVAGSILLVISCIVAILPYGILVAPALFSVTAGLFFLGRVFKKRARYNSLNRRAGN